MNKNIQKEKRLGIDIGRVIIDGSSHPNGGDTAFFQGDEETMLATPEMPGALEAIAELTEAFKGNVWLVSKCGPRVQQRSMRWLKAHNFYERTGVSNANLRFCKERKQKRGICTQLDIGHFIDDHPEVHKALQGFVTYQYFFGPQKKSIPNYGIETPTWHDTKKSVLENLAKH